MADVTDAQQKRAEARKRRRKQDEPEPESESTPQAGADGHDAGQGARQAAKVAAAIGAAGAAAAAAKALTSHGDEQKDEQDAEEPASDDRFVAEETEQPQDAAEIDEAQDAAPPEPEEEPERDEQPVQGAGAGDARRAIDRGREQLEDLLGRPVEKVSSLERTHDGWVLALEVVELQRIPETTDVLATYEMELDGDLNLRRYGQARRYNRGHTDSADDR